ncbi:MAG: hypothetical protein BroJett040_15160 [Oligoflexia bacterium]|nr:MAG: hypothetical protein BroJett040_15160 [Oligoflexia bacterium]
MRYVLSLLLFLPYHIAQAKLITATVGQVGSTVVTSREVQIASIIEGWFMLRATPTSERKKVNRKEWIVSIGSEAFQRVTSQVMLEHMVILEAENFSVVSTSPEEVKRTCDLIADELKAWNEWKKLEVSRAEMEQQVSRRLRAQAFLRFKSESTGVQISEEEMKFYYEKNRVKFGNLPYDQFKAGIRDYLTQKQLEERLKDWFEILKRKYHVRYIRPTLENDSQTR